MYATSSDCGHVIITTMLIAPLQPRTLGDEFVSDPLAAQQQQQQQAKAQAQGIPSPRPAANNQIHRSSSNQARPSQTGAAAPAAAAAAAAGGGGSVRFSGRDNQLQQASRSMSLNHKGALTATRSYRQQESPRGLYEGSYACRGAERERDVRGAPSYVKWEAYRGLDSRSGRSPGNDADNSRYRNRSRWGGETAERADWGRGRRGGRESAAGWGVEEQIMHEDREDGVWSDGWGGEEERMMDPMEVVEEEIIRAALDGAAPG